MTAIEHDPGKSARVSGGPDRCSTVWAIFSAKRSADMYICPRILGGAVKVSLHQSGSWQVGMTKEGAATLPGEITRHWDIWRRGGEMAPGTVRAWYLIIPDEELRGATPDAKAHQLPPVGAGHAASIEFLLISNDGPNLAFDNAHIVGRWRLYGLNESCLVIARRIPWSTEQEAWASMIRMQAVAQAEANGIPCSREHRYYFHGYDLQGVRFGLELAAIERRTY